MNVVVRCAAGALLIGGLCSAQEPSEAELRDAWSRVYLEAAKEVEFVSADGMDVSLSERPLLRWHNPVREGETHGDFFTWKRDGQPIVVGTLFSYIHPVGGNVRVAAIGMYPLVKEEIRYKFRSISGVLHGAKVDSLDVEVKTPAAAVDSPATRLSQLRSLARQCEAWTLNEGVEQPLRLLSQPLLLSEATPKGDDADGAPPTTAALFAMVTGTDPELLILIRRVASVSPASSNWQITPARFSDLPLKLSVQGAPVWQWQTASYPDPYVSRHQIFSKPLDPR